MTQDMMRHSKVQYLILTGSSEKVHITCIQNSKQLTYTAGSIQSSSEPEVLSFTGLFTLRYGLVGCGQGTAGPGQRGLWDKINNDDGEGHTDKMNNDDDEGHTD